MTLQNYLVADMEAGVNEVILTDDHYRFLWMIYSFGNLAIENGTPHMVIAQPLIDAGMIMIAQVYFDKWTYGLTAKGKLAIREWIKQSKANFHAGYNI